MIIKKNKLNIFYKTCKLSRTSPCIIHAQTHTHTHHKTPTRTALVLQRSPREEHASTRSLSLLLSHSCFPLSPSLLVILSHSVYPSHMAASWRYILYRACSDQWSRSDRKKSKSISETWEEWSSKRFYCRCYEKDRLNKMVSMVCAYSISTCDRFPFFFLFDHIVKNTNCLYTVYISFKGIRINVDYLVSINTEVTLLSHSCSLYFFPSQHPYSLYLSISISLSLPHSLSPFLTLPSSVLLSITLFAYYLFFIIPKCALIAFNMNTGFYKINDNIIYFFYLFIYLSIFKISINLSLSLSQFPSIHLITDFEPFS